MNDINLTPIEKYLKEVKDFSKVLLLLSVAMITIIGTTYNIREDVFFTYTLRYYSVILGQLFSIISGLVVHMHVIGLYRKMTKADKPERFFLQDNSQVKTSFSSISTFKNVQIIAFFASAILFTYSFVSWQTDPMAQEVKRRAEALQQIKPLLKKNKELLKKNEEWLKRNEEAQKRNEELREKLMERINKFKGMPP